MFKLNEMLIIAAIFAGVIYLVTSTNSKVDKLVERIDKATAARAPAPAPPPPQQQQAPRQQMARTAMPPPPAAPRRPMQQPGMGMPDPRMMARRAVAGAEPNIASLQGDLNMSEGI